MHYYNTAFSKNGRPTLRALGPNKHMVLGNDGYLTKTDIFSINALYDCKGMDNFFLYLINRIQKRLLAMHFEVAQGTGTSRLSTVLCGYFEGGRYQNMSTKNR